MINQILVNNSIQITNNKSSVTGRKVEEAKTETKKKIFVQKHTTSLFLQNNELRSIVGLPQVLLEVMYNSERLLWLDLSYNYLESIETDLTQF